MNVNSIMFMSIAKSADESKIEKKMITLDMETNAKYRINNKKSMRTSFSFSSFLLLLHCQIVRIDCQDKVNEENQTEQ
jgi:hypothetical protein